MKHTQQLKDAILRHVFLYRLTLEPVVGRLFFKDHPSAERVIKSVLRELENEGLLHRQILVPAEEKDKLPELSKDSNKRPKKPLPKIPCWTPTVVASRRLGKRGRGKPAGPQAMSVNLAILWFCCMGTARRYRLERDELEPLLGDAAPHQNTPQCIAMDKDGPRIYRIFVPSVEPEEAIGQVAESLEELAFTNRTLHEWIGTGDYGIAILGQTREKCAHLKQQLRDDTQRAPSLFESCRCIVELGPSPWTIRMCLKDVDEYES